MCGKLIKNEIVNLANEVNAFSVIADETADIYGTKQLLSFVNRNSIFRQTPKSAKNSRRLFVIQIKTNLVRQIKCSIRSYKHFIIYEIMTDFVV